MLDHGACDVTPGSTEMKKDSLLLGFEGSDTAGDILGIVSGEKLGDVVAEVFAGHRYSRRHTPGQVQRHFDADGIGFGVDVTQDRVGPDGVRVRYGHVRIVEHFSTNRKKSMASGVDIRHLCGYSISCRQNRG